MAAKNQNTVVTATQKTEPGAKKDALATALAQIEKQFGKGAVMKLGDNTAMQVDAISTGSLGLDMALGVGGVPRGRIIEVYGPESSGKTTLALEIGWQQREAVTALLEANGWVGIACRKDYGGNDRAVTARKPCK